MANPFKAFRKYQKSAFVALGIVTMLAFIVIPILMQWENAVLQSRDVTLATSQYGKIQYRSIQNLRDEIQVLTRFYSSAGSQINSETQQSPAGLRNRYESLIRLSDEAVVYYWLKIQKMKEMGFEVSKKFVGDYLKVLTDDKLTETGYSQVIESLGIPSDTVIFLLQRDILAQFFDEEYLNSVRGITPIKEFEWFNRFRRMSKIQAAAVEVDSLLDQVPDPSDRELREFFEANKFRVQNPNLEETGFAVPRKSAVEYLVFGYDNIDTGGITDEEVQKYYDENKESYKNTPETNSSGLGLGQPLPGIPGVNNLPFGNRPFPNLNLNRPPSAVPQGNLNLPGIEKRIEEASAENPSTSAEAVPAEPPPLPSEAVPAETSVPVELPAPVEPPAPEAAPAENPSSRMENRSLFVPVVYQTESETAASETVEEPPIEPPSEQSPEPSPTAEAPAAEPSPSEPETPVAAVPPTAETPAEQPVTEGIPVSEETALVPEVPDAADESVKKSKEEPLPPYKPLSEVADNIKVILARLKMNETLERIEQRMNEHYEEMNIYARRAADAVSGKEAAAAPVLDLKKIAEENGLVYKTAGMVDFYEMYKSDPDFAASVIDSAQFSQRTVLEMMYDASGLVESYPYRAINVTDNNRYLFRVTGVREQKTPDFNDPGVKEIVLKRWKEVKARPLAQEKAKQLAEAAKKSGKPLQEYFEAAPDPVVKRIVETDYFSWYEEPVFSYYQMPRLRLSEVRESGVEMGKAELQNKVIVAWGNTFMEDVFALQKGDYGTTVNQPQNTYYVVHVLEVTPTNEELVSLFNESPTQRSYISFFVLQDQFAAIQEAIDRKIQTVTHFKWLETPTAYNERLRNQEQRE